MAPVHGGQTRRRVCVRTSSTRVSIKLTKMSTLHFASGVRVFVKQSPLEDGVILVAGVPLATILSWNTARHLVRLLLLVLLLDEYEQMRKVNQPAISQTRS